MFICRHIYEGVGGYVPCPNFSKSITHKKFHVKIKAKLGQIGQSGNFYDKELMHWNTLLYKERIYKLTIL